MLFCRRQTAEMAAYEPITKREAARLRSMAIKPACGERDQDSLAAGSGASQAAPFPKDEESKITSFAAPRKGEHPDRITQACYAGKKRRTIFEWHLGQDCRVKTRGNHHGIFQVRR